MRLECSVRLLAQLVAHRAAIELTHGSLGHFMHEYHAPRLLVARQLGGHMCHQRRLIHLLAARGGTPALVERVIVLVTSLSALLVSLAACLFAFSDVKLAPAYAAIAVSRSFAAIAS